MTPARQRHTVTIPRKLSTDRPAATSWLRTPGPSCSSLCRMRLVAGPWSSPGGATSVQTESVLDVCRASKSFGRLRVLSDVSLTIKRGEMVGLIGASGSGKSTLIRTIAGLTPIDPDRRTGEAGSILLFGQPIQQRGRIARAATALRVRVGVIFQQFNLVPRLSVLTNVCLGLLGRLPDLSSAA